ncbi:hypothetical protein lerEdw1_014928, partial [Lerista edwardsae]
RRNSTYCSKVAFPLEVVHKDPGSCVSRAMKPEEALLYLEYTNVNLTCPDVVGLYPAGASLKVQWYMNCHKMDRKFLERDPSGLNLTFVYVRDVYSANYTCLVTYTESGRDFSLTRTLQVKVVGSPERAKAPQMTSPNKEVVYELSTGEDLVLPCKVFFMFLKGPPSPEVSWLIDGRNTDDIADLNTTWSETPGLVGDVTIERTLIVPKVKEEDLRRNYTCQARNPRGEVQRQAIVKLKVPVPRYTVELACGLGATVCLVVILTVVYHVYWLELVLFYRAHFGTDETILDGKEYDIYVSYARNAEEEEFVLLTLRGVLENEFGYKLCIFDRDSLPGGIVTDETLSFIQRSRRLLVVLSPNYVLQGTQALLELKAGLENMASRGSIKVILVQYKAVKKSKVKELRQAKAALTIIKWKGEESRYPHGRFWKQLQVEMPVKSRF